MDPTTSGKKMNKAVTKNKYGIVIMDEGAFDSA